MSQAKLEYDINFLLITALHTISDKFWLLMIGFVESSILCVFLYYLLSIKCSDYWLVSVLCRYVEGRNVHMKRCTSALTAGHKDRHQHQPLYLFLACSLYFNPSCVRRSCRCWNIIIMSSRYRLHAWNRFSFYVHILICFSLPWYLSTIIHFN